MPQHSRCIKPSMHHPSRAIRTTRKVPGPSANKPSGGPPSPHTPLPPLQWHQLPKSAATLSSQAWSSDLQAAGKAGKRHSKPSAGWLEPVGAGLHRSVDKLPMPSRLAARRCVGSLPGGVTAVGAEASAMARGCDDAGGCDDAARAAARPSALRARGGAYASRAPGRPSRQTSLRAAGRDRVEWSAGRHPPRTAAPQR